jgi:hypothetical protein
MPQTRNPNKYPPNQTTHATTNPKHSTQQKPTNNTKPKPKHQRNHSIRNETELQYLTISNVFNRSSSTSLVGYGGRIYTSIHTLRSYEHLFVKTMTKLRTSNIQQ